MDESKKLINIREQSQQDLSNNYCSINIPESQNTTLHQKHTVIISRDNSFKRNISLTFITLLIVILICFSIIGFLTFIDVLKADNDLNDDI